MTRPRRARLLPVDDDLDTGGFFDAARRGELAIRRCNGCDAVLHVPRMPTAATAAAGRGAGRSSTVRPRCTRGPS